MRRILLPVILLAGTSLARAADIEASSSIEAVTVFPDGAQVTRLVPLDLPAGSSTVILKDLAPGLDPASVRVEAQGRAPLLLGPVETRIVPGDPRPAIDTALEARIDALRAERDKVAGRSAAMEGKKRAIERYAEASPEKLSADAKPLDVAQWAAAWDAIGSGLAAVNEELRDLADKGRRLDAEIAALERGRSRPQASGAPRHDVTVDIESDGAATGLLRVTYRVTGAGWQPVYDVRLDTGAKDRKPTLDVVRRAQIAQRTGEDWAGVALTVSTTRIARGTGAPDLQPLIVNFWERADYELRNAPAKAQADSARAKSAGELAASAPAAAPVEGVEQLAEASSGAFQATFRVPGKVSVPQDGTAKTFALSTRKVEPALAVKTVPALDETAYLEAAFTLDDDVPLLAGAAMLHRDGSYVGRARISQTAPGDMVEIGFGSDDRVKVSRVPVRKRENDPGWMGNTRTDLRDFKTTVKNLHDTPIRITVLDQLPVSENTAITVEQVAPTTPPTDKAIADKRGVMGWTWDYQPGEQKEIRLAYRVKWPADREIVTRPQPIIPVRR